jgi:hypothetical protein
MASKPFLQAYTGTYVSANGGIAVIWLENGTLHIKNRDSSGQTYFIAKHPVESSGWPSNLFPRGRLVPDTRTTGPGKHKGSASHIISFFRSSSDPKSIESFSWKMNDASAHQRFTKTGDEASGILALPNELQEIIYEYALTRIESRTPRYISTRSVALFASPRQT